VLNKSAQPTLRTEGKKDKKERKGTKNKCSTAGEGHKKKKNDVEDNKEEK